MTNNGNQGIESVAQSLVDDAPHYVNAISTMSERHELCATEDILSSSGIKLIARGSKIDKQLREKLSSHRLSGATLEKSLSISGGVTPESLARDISRLIDNDPWLRQLAAKSGDSGALRHGASRLLLPHEILFRLTVAREQRPELYRHSLRVTIIGHYLALRMALKPAAINNVLIAALCHDLGELYTDSAILSPGHRVTDEERRFIYVHPITGWLIVRDVPDLNSEVEKAIIQHQERLDGSGYPFGIKSDEITVAGRILAAADVSASIMMRFSDHHRLSTLLRLNSTKYDRKMVDLLHEIMVPEVAHFAVFQGERLKKRLLAFTQLINTWSRLRANNDTAQIGPVIYLTDRMYNLRTAVLACGFDPDSLDMPLALAEEDPIIATELAAVVDELQFQLADLERETDRRLPGWLGELDSVATIALNEWRQQLRDCNYADATQ